MTFDPRTIATPVYEALEELRSQHEGNTNRLKEQKNQAVELYTYLQQISSKQSTRVVPGYRSSQVATVLHQAEIRCSYLGHDAPQSRGKSFEESGGQKGSRQEILRVSANSLWN